MTVKAKVFMSGRSQAIRLPAKLRIQSSEVMIEQVGDALWIQPQQESTRDMGEWLKAFYAGTEALPEAFLAERGDAPAQSRDWT